MIAADAFATAHPVFASSQADQYAASLLFRPLVWPTLDHRIDPGQSLAASVTPESGDTVFRVRLRPWHWSDGSAVTADDVVFDWSLIRALGSAYPDWGDGGVPSAIRSVRAVDPATVLFTMRARINPELFELSGLSQFFPLPRRAWGAIPLDAQETAQSSPSFYRVVDGPFRLSSLDPSRAAVFERNDRFDGHRAGFRRLVLLFLPSNDVLEALRTDTADIGFVPPAFAAHARRLRGFTMAVLRSRGSFHTLTPNLRNPAVAFFRDRRVRQAIARAIDQPRLVRDAMNGYGAPRYGFIPSTAPDWLAPDLRDGHTPLPFDPSAARALLDAAGARPGPDGTRLRFTLLMSAEQPEFEPQLELMQDELRRVGIAMSIRYLSFSQLLARMLGPPSGWEAIAIGHASTPFPDMSSTFGTGGSDNDSGWSDARTDALLAAVRETDDRAAFDALQDDIATALPVIFRPETTLLLLSRSTIAGVDRLYALDSMLGAEWLRPATGADADPR